MVGDKKHNKRKMKYYVYRHIRLDTNQVFYVGVGTKKSTYMTFEGEYTRARATQNRTKHWNRVVEKTRYEVEIIFESDDREEIFQKEIEFIKLYGRQDLGEGTLVNYSNGGEGTTGIIVSDETKKLLSEKMKGRKLTSEHKQKIKDALKICHPFKGRKHSDQTKQKISQAKKGIHAGEKNPNYGKITSEEVRKKLGFPVAQYDLDGNFIQEFYSIMEASRQTGCCNKLIGYVCRGIYKTHNGFIWKHTTDKKHNKKEK